MEGASAQSTRGRFIGGKAEPLPSAKEDHMNKIFALIIAVTAMGTGCTEMAPPGELTAREACKIPCEDMGIIDMQTCRERCNNKWKEGERIPKKFRTEGRQ
jgi:Ni/Co efflux regulator RcnB